MAYGDVIDSLNPDHRWSFDNTLSDQVGSADGTATGTDFVTTPLLCEDNSYSLRTDATGDRVTIPDQTDMNSSAHSRRVIAGWFRTDSIQPPPKRIYGEGDGDPVFQIVMAFGNNVMFEAVDKSNNMINQVFGPVLKPNRTYHLCMRFSGSGYNNLFDGFVDGVKMLDAEPSDRQPDVASFTSGGDIEFGDPAGSSGVGGDSVLLNACTNGYYAQWASWSGSNAELTDTEIREELFEKGAIPDITISSDTESNMQTALDAYKDTERGNYPLCIRVEAVSGGGDFTLEADNITFDELASIHVQYTGTDTLTWINKNGSNASIFSTPNNGTIIRKDRVTVTITVKDVSDGSPVDGARVYIEAAAGGDLPEGTEIMNTTTNSSGIASISFDYTSDQPITGRVRRGSSTPYYKTGTISGSITSTGLDQVILLIPDE